MDKIISKDNSRYIMGISIILVVLFHYSQYIEGAGTVFESFMSYFFSCGSIGVNFFFIVSSYGLCYSLNNNSIVSFYRRRVERIYPIFLVALIMSCIKNGHSLIDMSGSILFNMSGMSVFTDYYRNWFLEALTVLYIFFPLLYRMVDFLSRHTVLFLLSCYISLFSIVFISNFTSILTISRIPMILCGILFYFYERNRKIKIKTIMACLSLSSIFSFVSSSYLYVPLIVFTIGNIDDLPLRKCLSFVGKYTLEIYIGHIFARYIFEIYGIDFIFIVYILLTIVFSIILHYFHSLFWKSCRCVIGRS